MKDKVLMIAVAASAGYAGGKLGAAQVETKEVLYATENVIVGDPRGNHTRISPTSVLITGPKGIDGASAFLSARESNGGSLSLRNPDGASTVLLVSERGGSSLALGNASASDPAILLWTRKDRVTASVGLLDKNHIEIAYEHGSPSTIVRVLTGGRARKLVAD